MRSKALLLAAHCVACGDIPAEAVTHPAFIRVGETSVQIQTEPWPDLKRALQNMQQSQYGWPRSAWDLDISLVPGTFSCQLYQRKILATVDGNLVADGCLPRMLAEHISGEPDPLLEQQLRTAARW